MSPYHLDPPRAADDPPTLRNLDDEVLRHELIEWSVVVRDENGDLPRSAWAQIDTLLDELGRRLGL